MRKLITAILVLIQTYSTAQSDEQFFGFVVQGKDTLDISKGLKNYGPIRFSWINKTSEKLKTIEVYFGNGDMPFSTKSSKINPSQKLIVVDVPEYLAIDKNDIDSPRKREAEVSRIVILCILESPNKYVRYTIPFKIRE